MEVTIHSGVTCARGSAGFGGFKLDVYCYISDGIIVDTGPSRMERDFTTFFSSQKARMAVLTHHHEDHSGNAAWLQQRGLPVYIHEKGLALCREPARLPLYRRYFWGGRPEFTAVPLPSRLEGNSVQWQVIETPGHADDQVALYNPESGALFSGDLYVSPKTRIVMKGESIPAIMQSLRLVLEKDFTTLYCAHAGVVENGRDMVRMKLENLENTIGEVLALHSRGLTVKAINKRLYTKKASMITFISNKEWASENIIRSIIDEMA